jgi:hypothetical protein
MKRLLVAPIVLAIVAMAGIARAEDPSGTWKWTAMMGNNTREVTLKLKLDGDKLTGTITMGTRDTEIADGTYKDGDVAFNVVRERNGNKTTTKYTGKVSGDSIKGKIESERNGQTNSRDWEAKREKA